MNCLVTGGCGFIGSNLVDALVGAGHTVTVIDNEYSDAHDQFYYNEKVHYVKQDICNYDHTRIFYCGVDWVFHLAAEARIQPAIKNPLNAVRINTLGTATVLQCSREANVSKVIYSSTSSAYGFNSAPNSEIQEDDCLNPYSVSKVAGEKLCSMYTDLFDLNTVVFRYFNVYGERQPLKGQYAPVIGIFLRQLANGEELTVVGDGEQRRDFTHVSDVVRANMLAATADIDESGYGEVYNVGNGKNYSVNEIAAMISPRKRFIDARPGEARITLADNTKLRTTFGWEPTVQLEDWVSKAVDSVKSGS
jgi:UDP-glucose 4-epimerase|tara:strand:- start:81 stop:998 length:918 start_codon:yes stop_codon:yes gene_type:complete